MRSTLCSVCLLFAVACSSSGGTTAPETTGGDTVSDLTGPPADGDTISEDSTVGTLDADEDLVDGIEPADVADDGVADGVSPGDTTSDAVTEAHAAVCHTLCDTEANCYKSCEFDEDPECDEEANYLSLYTMCNDACTAGGLSETTGQACQEAAVVHEACQETATCGALDSACFESQMRYHELCVTFPGDWICGFFCGELETGCIPPDIFGYSGTDCEATCLEAVVDEPCREAHYALETCTEGLYYGCSPLEPECTDELETVTTACEPWEPGAVDPADEAFCTGVVETMCACEVSFEPDCLAKGVNACLFQLGQKAGCHDALAAFDTCMEAIEGCTRDLVLAQCMDEWHAWTSECE